MSRHRWDPVCAPPRGLVHPVPVDPRGLAGPTRGRARGPGWRQSSHGLYVPSYVDPTVPEQRILEQAARLPRDGAVTGWAACRLHGASFFDGLATDGATRLPVPLVLGARGQLAPGPGCTVSRERLLGTEVVTRLGVRCTAARRALFDEMRRVGDVREAVVAMDMMAAAELVSVAQMRAYVAQRPAWAGVGQVRRALPLASEHSRSPNETRLRLLWVLDAGLPTPLVNQEVYDRDGRLLGIADLLDPVAGVVGEYDGAEHRSALRHSRDVARQDAFRRVGLEYFTVVGPDLRSPGRVLDRILATRARARWLPEDRRAWTTRPPAWRTPTSPLDAMNLDERLAYRAWLAEDPTG